MDFNLQSIKSQIQQYTSSFPILSDVLSSIKEKLYNALNKISNFTDSSEEMSGLIEVNDELVPLKDVVHYSYLHQQELDEDEKINLLSGTFTSSLSGNTIDFKSALSSIKRDYDRSTILSQVLVGFDVLHPSDSIKQIIALQQDVVKDDELLAPLNSISDDNYAEVLGGVIDSISQDPQVDTQDYSVKGKTGKGLGVLLLQVKIPAIVEQGIQAALVAIGSLGYGILTVIGYAAKCIVEFIPNLIRLVKGYGPVARGNSNVDGITPIPLFDITVEDHVASNSSIYNKYGCWQEWLTWKFLNKTVITQIGPLYIKLSLIDFVDHNGGMTHWYDLKWRIIAYGSAHGNISLSEVTHKGLVSPGLDLGAWTQISVHPSTSDFDFYITKPKFGNNRMYSLIPAEMALGAEIRMVHNPSMDSDHVLIYDIRNFEHYSDGQDNWLYKFLNFPGSTTGGVYDTVCNPISLGTVSSQVYDQYLLSDLTFIRGVLNDDDISSYIDKYYCSVSNHSTDNYLLGTELLYRSLASIDDAWNLIGWYYWHLLSDEEKEPITANDRYCYFSGDTLHCKVPYPTNAPWYDYSYEWFAPLHSTDQFSYYGDDLHHALGNIYHDAYAPSGLLVEDLTYVGDHRTSVIWPYLLNNTQSETQLRQAVGCSTMVPLINYDDQSIAQHWKLAYGNQDQEGYLNNDKTIASEFLNFEFELNPNVDFYPFGHYHKNFINFITHQLWLKDNELHREVLIQELGATAVPYAYNSNVIYFDLPELTALPGKSFSYVSDVERALRTTGQIIIGGIQIGAVLALTSSILIKRWANAKRIENENNVWSVMGDYDPSHPEGYTDSQGNVHPSKKELIKTTRKANFSNRVLSLLGGRDAYGELINDNEDNDGFTLEDIADLITG